MGAGRQGFHNRTESRSSIDFSRSWLWPTDVTLNDRGKALPTFEKLKSLIMEYDLDFCEPQDPVSIHNTFGKIYVILDHKDCYVDESQFVQLSAINLWVSDDIEIPSMAADTLYRSRFRVDSPSKENVGSAVHQEWLPTFSKLSNEIDHLTGILNGTDPCCNEDSRSVKFRTVWDDYLTVFNSLGLSTRSLAVLLKFREVYKCDWHEATGKIRLNNEWIKKMLTERSQGISGYISTHNVDGPIRVSVRPTHLALGCGPRV